MVTTLTRAQSAAHAAADAGEAHVWQALTAVADPEIPVVSIVDLGIVRFVRFDAAGKLEVGLTPTYSGCPATEVIRRCVRETLQGIGYPSVVVTEVLSPPWTTDWITPSGRQKLAAFGIAPPAPTATATCPRCASRDTRLVSEFGSTPCKAHYQCRACLEPFDRFKCL
ncbi:MAG TPA: 1,2-phenylacetyl-CoA epoxidase subunit PaaD [Steroidobacteraceae bacterium]|jgi:ring-1,2-phenylacetyl-CoA epoxidase subunit PaaD